MRRRIRHLARLDDGAHDESLQPVEREPPAGVALRRLAPLLPELHHALGAMPGRLRTNAPADGVRLDAAQRRGAPTGCSERRRAPERGGTRASGPTPPRSRRELARPPVGARPTDAASKCRAISRARARDCAQLGDSHVDHPLEGVHG
jgi:hypothetical protein